MKWTIKLVAEVVAGKPIEHEIALIERPGEISPANVGLTIEEGKAILESLQNEVVTAQVQRFSSMASTFDLARGVEARFARRATTVPRFVLFTGRLACV
jgi:hypothetical protein